MHRVGEERHLRIRPPMRCPQPDNCEIDSFAVCAQYALEYSIGEYQPKHVVCVAGTGPVVRVPADRPNSSSKTFASLDASKLRAAMLTESPGTTNGTLLIDTGNWGKRSIHV